MIHMLFSAVLPFILFTHPIKSYAEDKVIEEVHLTVENHITVPTIMTKEAVGSFLKDYKERAIPYLKSQNSEPFYFIFISGGGYLEPWKYIRKLIEASVKFRVVCLYCLSEAANTFIRIHNYKYITSHTKVTFHKIRYIWEGALTQEDALYAYEDLKKSNSELTKELLSKLNSITKDELSEKLKGDWDLSEKEIEKHLQHDGKVKLSCSQELMDKTRKIYTCTQSTNLNCIVEVSECPLLQL